MLIWTFLRSQTGRAIAFALLGLVGGVYLHARFSAPKVVERVIENTRVVTVEVPVLSEKIVTKYLTDPKDKAIIIGLLAKNKELGVEVASLSQTIAELKQSGGTDSGGIVTPPTPENPQYTYKDFQLLAVYRGEDFVYDLYQTFEVLSTTGRAKDGSKVGLTNLYQIGQDGERIPIPAKTTVIFADEAATRWFISGRIQAGFGVSVLPAIDKGGVVAFQWLKRGKSRAAEDVTFAVLSPVLFLGEKLDIGVLPVSWNLGSLPRQPFTNVWVSPLITRTRAGLVLSATF